VSGSSDADPIADAADEVDAEAGVPTRAERRQQGTADTRTSILAAARERLLAVGYANLSTRAVAEAAEVPLSQIHYHFGSKQQLILAILAGENERLLARQRAMFAGPEPLWRQWERACDYLDEDLESGYVRVLQEMIAAGWSDAGVAAAVREYLSGWFRLLADVAGRESARIGGLGEFTAAEIAALMGLPFTGAESLILLGVPDEVIPARSALRKLGGVIRLIEEGRRTAGTQADAR
jgi:AcrR family transcriptional regulator